MGTHQGMPEHSSEPESETTGEEAGGTERVKSIDGMTVERHAVAARKRSRLQKENVKA